MAAYRRLPGHCAAMKYANVTSTLALIAAMAGTGYAAVSLNAGSVTTREIKDGTILPRDLSSKVNVVSAKKLRDAVVEVVTDPNTPAINIHVSGEKGDPGPVGGKGQDGAPGTPGTTGQDGAPGAPGSAKAYAELSDWGGQDPATNAHDLVALPASGGNVTWCVWSSTPTTNIQVTPEVDRQTASVQAITSPVNRNLWCPVDESHPWQWAVTIRDSSGQLVTSSTKAFVVLN